MVPGRYTELFFLDEATAFAAGHRPCAECRREDYNRFIGHVGRAAPGPGTGRRDRCQLHRERVDPVTRGQRRHPAAIQDLPDGAFVLLDGARGWCSATRCGPGPPRATPTTGHGPGHARARRRVRAGPR